MDPAMIIAISEIAKMGLVTYMNYMQAAGLNQQQIDEVYEAAKAAMLSKDPAKIPT